MKPLPLLLLSACTSALGPKDTGLEGIQDSVPTVDPCPVALVTPTEVTWTDLAIGTPAEAVVTVENGCTGATDLSVVASVSSGFTVSQDVDAAAPGGVVTATVSVTLTDYGPLEGVLLLETDDPSAPEIEVPLYASADPDQDGDGYDVGDDCDDTDAAVFPGATETWYDGVDGDCAGDDDFDQDADGYDLGDDCDDTDASVFPGAEDAWYDGVDSDCAGNDDHDQDGDGYDLGEDCDDTDASVHPGATETWYDGVDSDCAGDGDYDQDGDGFEASADCDDTDANVYPGAPETWYDGIDSDCGGDDDYDQDGDGYDLGEDCDDTDAAVSPDAVEIADDGVDNDCDGTSEETCTPTDWYADADGDGYGDPSVSTSACDAPVGYVADASDCDDADGEVNPAAEDVCDGIDNDCDGAVDGGWAVPADYATIGAAIAAASGGEHICVAAGTYVENIDFSGKDLVVESIDGAEVTILQGSGLTSVVTFENGETSAAELRGFTVTGGGGDTGGGVYIEDAGPTLVDLIVTGNELVSYYGVGGGGINVSRGTLEAIRVEISDNSLESTTESVYGAGIHAYASTLYLTDVRIVGNRADGGYDGDTVGVGLSVLDGTVYARRLEVLDNTGSPMPVNAGMGIGLRSSDLIGTNVVVAGNSSDDGYGAGICVEDGHLGLRNATIVENDSGASATGASGMYLDDATAVLWNVAITDNLGGWATDGLTAAGDSDVTFRYDDLYDNGSPDVEGVTDPVGSDGTIAVAPDYTDVSATDAADWDLTLASGSALIDAGDPTILDDDGTASDIGAWSGPDASAGEEGSGCVAVDWYPDADRDGFGVSTGATSACAWPGPGWGRSAEDCDDTRDDTHPLSVETCDGTDEDCDGTVDFSGCTWSLGDSAGSLYGEAAGDGIGEVFAVLGDVDGDGIVDIGVSSTQHAGTASYAGKVWVTSGAVTGEVGLATATASVDGDNRNDRLGAVVAPAGDVDADGYADVWITSTRNYDGGANGSAWLFNGPLSGDFAVADAALAVYATSAIDNLGSALVGDADLDGDGDLDLLVGAEGASGNSGAALLFLDGPAATGTLYATDADATLTGEGSSGGAGDSAAVGDLDGDGVNDLVIGASSQDTSTLNNAGVVYVLTHTPSGTEALADADGRLTGDQASSYAGGRIAYAGDVDGDGLGDLLIGQVWGGSAGEGTLWVIPGPATGDTPVDAVASGYVRGNAASDALGFALAACGDVDGDGFADVAAGAYAEDTEGSSAGAVYRFYGPITGALTAADAASVIYGESPSDQAGRALAAGDLDGDGVSELLVGAPERTSHLGSDGEIYIVSW